MFSCHTFVVVVVVVLFSTKVLCSFKSPQLKLKITYSRANKNDEDTATKLNIKKKKETNKTIRSSWELMKKNKI